MSTQLCVAGASNTNPVKLVNNPVSNASSTALFTRYNERFSPSQRYYSSNGSDKKATNDTDDDDLTNWNRRLPRFGDHFEITPSLYLMLKNALSILLIRSYFDQNFNKNEFLAGARKAVEVIFMQPNMASKLLTLSSFMKKHSHLDVVLICRLFRIYWPMPTLTIFRTWLMKKPSIKCDISLDR